MSQRYGLKTFPPVSNTVSSLYKSYNRNKDNLIPNPTFSTPQWSRPSDWLSITPPSSSEQKIVMLVKVTSADVNYLSVLCRGAYAVDWGDGVVENFADNTQANHEYTFASISDSTLTTEGFKQVIVTITPQAANNITVFNMQTRHPKLPTTGAYVYPVLELYVSAPNLAATASFAISTTSTSPGTWGIYYINAINLGNLNTYVSLFATLRQLKKVDLTASSACTLFTSLFNNCTSLQQVNITGNTSNVTSTVTMFNSCAALETAPFFDTSNVTNMNNMFAACSSLINVPLYNTSKVVNFYRMFIQCYALKQVPLFNVSAATSTAGANGLDGMFYECSSLESVPPFNTSSAGNMAGMFYNCFSLKTVPHFDTSNVTNMNAMFGYCNSLTNVPWFNTSKVTNFYQMFLGCTELTTVPLFDVSAATSSAAANGLQGMFQNCTSLESVPLFNTSNARNVATMFTGCRSLKTVPLFDTKNVLTMNNMFAGCFSLVEVPALDTSNVRDAGQIFYQCYNLKNVGITSFPAATGTSTAGLYYAFESCRSLAGVTLQMPLSSITLANMFANCYSLTALPADFNSVPVDNLTSTFQNCYSLTTIPSSLKTDLVTNMTNTFNGCTNLVSLPPLNVIRVATYTTTFANCPSLETAPLSNIIANISFASCKLGISAVETVYDGLTANPATARTITITNNPGTITYSIASITTTAGSISATTSTSTASLSVGMYVTGTGTSLTTGRAVTFTDAGDLVNLTAHGLSDNDIVAFSVITTTTGITRYTSYYVVNATADTFQVSDTLGGAARTLTTNGTGTVIYPSQITSIVTGTPNTIILSRPQASTATNTLTFRQSNVSKAILKGWTVTGG